MLRVLIVFTIIASHVLAEPTFETVPGKLILAQVIYANGDKSADEELSKLGIRQQYELGQWLRARYSTTLLNPKRINHEIYVRSTDRPYAISSALANLAGLAPPEGEQIWKPDLKWQPIAVYNTPVEHDSVLGATAACARYTRTLNELRNSQEFLEYAWRYQPYYAELTNNSGQAISTMEDVQSLNRTLNAQRLAKKPLPAWSQKYFGHENMTWLTNFVYRIPTYTPLLARLKSGPLLKEILERFQANANRIQDENLKLWAYSGDDTTIANMLNTLRLFDPHSPPMCATILFELRLDATNQTTVSIFYKNSTAEPEPLAIPNCDKYCPLEKLLELYKNVLPDQWIKECEIEWTGVITNALQKLRNTAVVTYLANLFS